MSERIHGLAQLLPDKASLEDCSLEELRHITKRFPYFAPAQFLLLQKLKETGSPDYETQHCKAVLYFPEPLLFDYFISADKFEMDEMGIGAVKSAETLSSGSAPEQPLLAEAAIADDAFIENDHAVLPSIYKGSDDQESEHEQENSLPLSSELPPPPPVQALFEEPPLLTEPDKVKEPERIEPGEPVVLPVLPLQEIPETFTEAEAPETAALVVAPRSVQVAVTEEGLATTKNGAAPTAVSTQRETMERSAQQQPKTGEPLTFEPYHTVDYFASQGIKISSDALPKDKLSHQLRSFTEWLKVMKRLPAAEMEAVPQTTAEKTVESLASHSVEGGEVVTEAMAEVWARQGNKKKAIDTYNKLSLQIPSKKAYFAAKIENLSGT